MTNAIQDSDYGIMYSYLNRLKEIKNLTKEEEIELFLKKDKKSKEKFMKHYLRLVFSIAIRYKDNGVELSDLIQEGSIGLLTAYNKFDLKFGCRFTTYAIAWIRRNIIRALCQKSRTIRIPVWLYGILAKYKNGKELTEKEYAKVLRIKMLSKICSLDSLDADFKESFMNIIQDLKSIDPEEVTESKLMKEFCINKMNILSDKEKYVIESRYDSYEKPKSFLKIGQELNLSKQRIEQIKTESIEKIKEAINDN